MNPITHELAKKLKKTGLKIKNPTLSELIDACGHGFVGLLSPSITCIYSWCAIREMPEVLKVSKNMPPNSGLKISNGVFTNGLTPEEAIAKLYIELNQK